jgi:hypothetical protein
MDAMRKGIGRFHEATVLYHGRNAERYGSEGSAWTAVHMDYCRVAAAAVPDLLWHLNEGAKSQIEREREGVYESE